MTNPLHALFTLHPTQLDVASFQATVFFLTTVTLWGFLIMLARNPSWIGPSIVPQIGLLALEDEHRSEDVEPNLFTSSASEVMHALGADIAPIWMKQIKKVGLLPRTEAMLICDALIQFHISEYNRRPQKVSFCSYHYAHKSPLAMLQNAPPYVVPLRTGRRGMRLPRVDGASLTHQFNHSHSRPGRLLQIAAIACLFQCAPRTVEEALKGEVRRRQRDEFLSEISAFYEQKRANESGLPIFA